MNPLAPVTATRPLMGQQWLAVARTKPLDWRREVKRVVRSRIRRTAAARVTWSSTFRRFPPGPMTVVGPLTLGVHDWAAPQPGQPQMFNYSFLERFTGTRPRTLVVIFLPIAVGFVWVGRVAGWSPGRSASSSAPG